MKKFTFLIIAALALLLSGCIAEASSNLLAVPKLSGDFLALQKKIDEIARDGAVQATPSGGENLHTIQLIDLNGDGTKEAVSFFRSAKNSTEYSVYVHKKVDSEYVLLGKMTGHGLGIDSVYYPLCSSSGERAVAVLWTIGETVNAELSVGMIENGSFAEKLSVQSSKLFISDLENDNINEIISLVKDPSASEFSAKLFYFSGTDIKSLPSVALSSGIRSIEKIQQGKLSDGSSAVFIDELVSGRSCLTDVLVLKNNTLSNISVDSASGISSVTYRPVALCSADIHGDGVLAVPIAAALVGYSDSDSSPQWCIEWNSVGSDGALTPILNTYHNSVEGWYIIWDNSWNGKITVEKSETGGQKLTTFCEYKANVSIPLFSIYTLADSDYSKPLSENDIQIGTCANAAYYLAFPTDAPESRFSVSEEAIRNSFRIISKISTTEVYKK